MNNYRSLRAAAFLLTLPAAGWAADGGPFAGPRVGPIPVEFIRFAGVLGGVAMVHLHALKFAIGGAVGIALYKVLFSPFVTGGGIGGLAVHLGHEVVLLSNLLMLLLGFALLAKHFEDSEVPAVLPRFLPNDWPGCFVLLVLVFVLSGFLDNIAAAMIGGAIAHTVFGGRVPGLIAVVIYALPPVIRFTNLGLRQVDRDLLEAADACGSTAWQRLWRVQLPLALPTVMAGVNQTIMLSLAMVVIAAMIGVPGLGQPVLKAISNQYFAMGLFNGLAIVGIAMVFDRVSQAGGQRLQRHLAPANE